MHSSAGRGFHRSTLSPAGAVRIATAMLAFAAATSPAGEARLKNGFVIEGKPVPLQGLTNALAEQSAGPTTVYPILMIDNGKQRYFVAARQVEEVNHAADLSKYEKFKLRQKLSGRKTLVQSLGGFVSTPFDEYGRRTVTINTSRGSVSIVQGITEITPKHVTVTGLTHVWENALATTSPAIPPKTLDAMIRRVTNQSNPDERLSIARFYLQAGLYFSAADELDAIVRDFPELKGTVQEVTVQLQQLVAKQLLSELRRRKAAGQEQLAYAAAKAFPTENMSSEVLREVRELILSREEGLSELGKVVNRMGDLQAELNDPKSEKEKRAAEAGPIRSAISEALDVHALDRLDAFRKYESDPTLKPAEKLALAFSGWVSGGANADTDFARAADLWKARHLVLEYLRSDDARQRSDLVREMKAIDFTPQKLLQMIPVLPPPVETQGIEPGKPFRIEVAGKNGEAAAAYHVLLPPEYSPNRKYPLIIALCAFGNPRDELAYWGRTHDAKTGLAQQRGYIVAAPEWIDPALRDYDYGVVSHEAVRHTLRDARQRFVIDSDRVYLSGHGIGADAAFDIGMSHPDLFAGVIPIVGFSDKYCKWYWPNAKYTAWYIVAGELDRDSMVRNAREVNRMLKYGHDLIYTEFIGRGLEAYEEEIPRILDWMELHKRQPQPAEIDVKVLRPGDDRFFWFRANRFPTNVTQAAVLADDASGRSRITPMNLTVRVTEGNSIYIQSGPPTAASDLSPSSTIWLTPDLVDFEKRVLIRQGGRQKHNDFVAPSLEAILEDLRLRGDRERVYQVEIPIT